MSIIDDRSNLSYSILKTIFDSFPNPAYIWRRYDDSFLLVDYNAAAKSDDPFKINSLLNESTSEFFKRNPLIFKKLNECLMKKNADIKEIMIQSPSENNERYFNLNFFFVPSELVLFYITDITSLILVERDLKNSKEKYKHLFEQAPFPIILFNNKANIIDCNKATEQIFGYEKKDLINQNYLKLSAYPSEYIPVLKERLQKSWKGIAEKPFQLKLYKKDGTIIWIISIVSKVNIKGFTIFQAFLLDTTELKKANELIKHKLEIEKVISSISSRFIGNVDIDDAIDSSLIEMGSLIGAKRAYLIFNNEDRTVEFYSQVSCSNKTSSEQIDFVNLRIDDFPYILKKYEEKGFVYIKSVLALPKIEAITKTQLQKLHIESLLLFPIKIKDKLLGFIGFDNLEDSKIWRTDDFTLLKTSSEIIGNALERKWDEETLKNTNQLLTAILCSLTECVILIDREFNIIWVNNETENLFSSEFVGKKCFQLLLNSNKPCKHCIARKTFSDGSIHENEYNFKDQSNKSVKFWSTTNVASLDKNDAIELVIIVLRPTNKLNQQS